MLKFLRHHRSSTHRSPVDWIHRTINLLMVTGLVALAASALDWYWSMPQAYFSVATQRCVRVETIPLQKRWTCDDLTAHPGTNYSIIWVP